MNDQLNNENQNDGPQLETGRSKVSISPKQSKIALIFIIVLGVFLIYYLFFKEKKPLKDEKKNINQQAELQKKDLSNVPLQRPANIDNDLQIPSIPKLPDPPPLVAPTPPPAPPAPVIPQIEHKEEPKALPDLSKDTVSLNALPVIDKNQRAAADARKKSSIMLVGGGGGGGAGAEGKGSDTSTSNVSNSFDYNYKPGASAAPRNRVTNVGNLSLTITQGKIIDTVLETSINTDLPGIVRGIISRDVYAESGKNILLPKGSRLIGSYSAAMQMGQSRVAITWDRIIRPDGIDLQINSQGVDKLGHAGVTGQIDNKYFDILSNAILLSVINIGLAATTEKITNAQASTNTAITNGGTTAAGGTTTTTNTSTPTGQAIQDSITSMNSTTSDLLKNSLNTKPSIVIDQGTLIKVLVNQDIMFPSNIATGMMMIK